ncbi:uncharacterized protein LOC117727804 isoform X2 [Cyclopterus lumpus]|uniref:uncharacterized protein LOC117727804 isoform X2 n=1 Tax=Cyclopterus lumpus TaxID=8103 RepID=UPI00148682AD|nr:uncharacterized protein LOC117727804 isoform X2 [Cyclopterus lumpus]
MAALRGLQVTSLLLRLTAITGATFLSSIIRAGEEVTLPSSHLITDQHGCNGSTWLYSRSRSPTVQLFILGKIKHDNIYEDKSNRLRLTANCSLVIRNVTDKDFGVYIHRQFNKAGDQQGLDVEVLLSVVYMEEHLSSDYVSLTCSVLTNDDCNHKAEWLYAGDAHGVQTSRSSCSASVTFPAPPLHQKKPPEFLRCRVTDRQSGRSLLYGVCTASWCEKTGGTSEGENKTSSANGRETRMGVNAVHHEGEDEDEGEGEGEGTVTYENVGEPSASIRFH